MNLAVLGDRVFVRPDVAPDLPVSDIVLTDQQRLSVTHGTVVAVGEGPELIGVAVSRAMRALFAEMDRYILNNEDGNGEVRAVVATLKNRGKEILANYAPDHLVMPGDRVVFSPDAGEAIHFRHDDPLLVMRESDILAVMETAHE